MILDRRAPTAVTPIQDHGVIAPAQVGNHIVHVTPPTLSEGSLPHGYHHQPTGDHLKESPELAAAEARAPLLELPGGTGQPSGGGRT